MAVAKKNTEVRVGLFILAGLVMLGGLVLQFGKFRERLTGQYPLTVVFDDASGVIKGSEVRMGGARIGEVASVPELNEAVRVEVTLTINDTIRIPVGSDFQIASATLLGDKLIVVMPPPDRSGDTIAPGSRIQGAGLTGLDAIQSNAEQLSRDVIRIIREAEATFAKVDGAVIEIREAGSQLREAMDKVNARMLSDDNLARFDRTLENLATSSERWKSTSAELEPAVAEAREAIQEVKNAVATADRTLQSADRAIADLKPSLEKIPKAVDEFKATASKASRTLDRINDGEGMLGAMATDNEVAFDFKTFMRNLKDYGVLRYRNPAPAGKEPKEDSAFDGVRRYGPRTR
jgi:phospholipid/cholesterol/gamma-HCH transport system substrate-binding protein